MITRFSYSQLSSFTRCPMSYEFRYIKKIRVPVNGELICGDAYHKALAHAFTNIVLYKKAPSIQEVVQVYSDTWDERVRNNIIIDEGIEVNIPSVNFKGKDPGGMKDLGIKLVRIYYNDVMPKIIPAEVEVWKSTIYKGTELVSRIDLITWDGIVIDHKTKNKRFSEDDLTKDLQSPFYGLVLGKDKLKFEYHVALTTKKPKIDIVTNNKDKNDMDFVGKIVVAVWHQIQTGLFTPCPAGWWCSPTSCGYWGICKMPDDF